MSAAEYITVIIVSRKPNINCMGFTHRLLTVFPMFSAILQSRKWKKLTTFRNPKLRKVLTILPNILKASRQQNTVKVYLSAYNRFEKWATGYEELSVYPSNKLAISIYLLSLIQGGKSISVIRQFIYAASWIHRMGGYKNPTSNFMVKSILEGAKRILATPTQRKAPMTPNIMRRIRTHLKGGNRKLDLPGRRLMAFILTAYAGFLRSEEALRIKRSDIAFHTSYVAIFLLHSKTDVYLNGRTILIARSKSALDPFMHLFRYLQEANIPDDSDEYIFRRIRKDNETGRYQLRQDRAHISYTTIKENLLGALEAIGCDPKKYGTHSLRAGGATAAANNGVSDRLFKVHGRWRTDDAKDRYIEDSITKRLRVTLNLGL